MWTRISSELVFISSVNISQRKQKWKDYSHNVNCHENLEDHFYLSRISLELCWEALSTAVVAQITSLTFLQKLKTILTFQNIILWVHLFYWCIMYEFIPRVLLNLISKLHDDCFSYFWKLIFLGSYFKHFS